MRKVYKVGDPRSGNGRRQTCWTYVDLDSKYVSDSMRWKIYSAFEGVKSFPFKRIIFQFWRPFVGLQVLESLSNPYAMSHSDRHLKSKYRARCVKYQCNAQLGNPKPAPAWVISDGPVVAAFHNHLPEVVFDLKVFAGSPLVDAALECDLTCCFALPVFSKSRCLGVVECSTKHPSLLAPLFYDLKRQLESVGLNIYHLQGSWPYKTISGDLEAAKLEIQRALEIASESHALSLDQVWIPNQTLLVKLSRYPVDSDGGTPLKDFYNNFDVIPGEGLAWKTLQTHQPHLCRNIGKLSGNKTGVLALLKSTCASFVICLRSTHTGDLDYVFEFFWAPDRNHSILIEALLLTLSKHLPSFKSTSGEPLGDQGLSLVDVESSSSPKIPQGNESPVFVKKRKYQDDHMTNPEKAEDDDDDDNYVAILAAYRNQNSLFYLPTSSTLEYVMGKLRKDFELDPSKTYKLEYQVSPGQWSTLTCLDSCRNTDLVELRVLPNHKEVCVIWKK